MIIGEHKDQVIRNIARAAETGDFYAKVEVDDPVLTREQSDEIVRQYLARRNTGSYKSKAFLARQIAGLGSKLLNRNSVIEGIEHAEGISGGAIITSNHFGPLENTSIRHLARKLGKKRIFVVSQETNFAMSGPVGFLMNYADTIPLSGDIHYIHREFMDILTELIDRGEYVLIYPEQEMWFNYRKPRPLKRGAYYFASKLNAPIISCFVEMTDLGVTDKGEFNRVQYTIHVLDTLRPDPEKTDRENSLLLCQQDYDQKKAAYERAYGKELDYHFEPWDIAGWRGAST